MWKSLKKTGTLAAGWLMLFSIAVPYRSSASVENTLLLHTAAVAAQQSAEDTSCEAALDAFTGRQYATIDIHRAFAFTTAGLLLAADGMGLYHFLQLQQRGHEIRDRIGFAEDATDVAPQTGGVLEVWRDGQSQTGRVLHTSLIVLGALSYVTTATIELTMPRTSTSTSPVSSTRLHRYAFFLHGGLMAANIGLGILESWALANGKHDLVAGAGMAHLAVGFGIPVVMLGAGAMFRLPTDY